MRLLTAGFETGSVDELNGVAFGGGPVAVTTFARTGDYSMYLENFVLGKYKGHVFDANETELFFRFALRWDGITADSPLLRFYDAGAGLQATIIFKAATQTLDILDGSGASKATGAIVISENIWYVIQGYYKVDGAAGEITLKINNVTDATTSGDTDYTNVGNVRSFRLYAPTYEVGNITGFYIDDLAINDSAGSYQNTWIGLGGIYLLQPIGEGSTQDFSPSAGTVHWSLVDDVPRNTTDWVMSGTAAGEVELYTVEAPPDYVASIDTLNVIYQVAIQTSGSQDVADLVRQGTVNYQGGSVTVVSIVPDYVLYQGTTHYVQPNGSGVWGTAEVAAIEFGLTLV